MQEDPINQLKQIKAGIQPAPDGFKQVMSYAMLSKHTGIPERQLIRWMTGKNKISQAWMTLINQTIK